MNARPSAAMLLKVPCLLGVALLTSSMFNPLVAGERYALVIGVNECPDFRLAGGIKPRPLRGAESDAQEISKCCRETFHVPEKNLKLLLGKEAGLQAVRQTWTDLNKLLQQNDSLLFYFAGHGTQVKDQSPLDEEDDGLDEALCLADTTAEGTNLLLDDELGQWLEGCSAGKITVILDCCHAGTGTKDADDDLAARSLPIAVLAAQPKPENADWRDLRNSTKSLKKETIALFACQPHQQAYERRLPELPPPQRSGQFTHFLLKGLQQDLADSDRDGQIDGAELNTYIERRLDESFNQARTDATAKQQPGLEGTGVFFGSQ